MHKCIAVSQMHGDTEIPRFDKTSHPFLLPLLNPSTTTLYYPPPTLDPSFAAKPIASPSREGGGEEKRRLTFSFFFPPPFFPPNRENLDGIPLLSLMQGFAFRR